MNRGRVDLSELKGLLGQDAGGKGTRRLAVAESLTSGQVQLRIGAVSGASAYFVGGMTAYTLDQKVRHLGVDRDEAAACNCVSAAVARQMARGAVALFDADVGVATTGYAEVSPENGVSDPYAWWAVVERVPDGHWQEVAGRAVCLERNRNEVQAMVAERVLAELVDYLQTMAMAVD
ncbi:MAG: nicotinamide-nucleotide amidohydrolase family protein [Candidatus Synoicihabitans palmerolidicus]|nr:nicotinamide-nucleotide amidohydrolase family protein [Candidatus Synoicihabitans palmerolidicus]MCC5022140.1 nicotinamide-nucleotide amidohydrolase family protein [Candidatus Synoicihabitans palmerolidicus]